MRAALPAGGLCGGKPCWRPGVLGPMYKNGDATPDGVRVLKLKASNDGRASIFLKGKGPNVALPSLPLALPVAVQLQTDHFGGCWEAVFRTAGLVRNDGTQFYGTPGSPSGAFVTAP